MSGSDEFDIAIVGMAGRFPGARNLTDFWHNLAAGVESIARLTDREILESGVPESYLRSASYVKAAPVLDEPGHFDAAYFGFTPAEARTLDPQHRLLLELAHEALEHAGYDSARYAGRVGVFMGSALNTYFTNVGLNRRLTDDYIPTLISNDKDFLSTRISYKLDLKGPSMTVQTACSTSLVAIHLARQSLLSGETDMTLVGAVSVRVPHRAGYVCDGGGIVSPDGHVRAFDAKANGTVFGSGGGVLVLKRLSDALADGDAVYAVIKGSAVNNDGVAKAGYSAPSVNGQADAVAEALANAGVSADSIGYVEAHGSGTPVGDPIEVRALTKAFRLETQRSGYCALGSVKTNVGHLDAAAGMASTLKVVLSLHHKQIPASLNFSEPNPELDLPRTPFFVNTALRDWTGTDVRRAGVMSTGMGGTNAHIIVEEAPAPVASSAERPPHLLVLSARTEAALDQATHDLREFLLANEAVNMSDAAYTLQVGRKAHAHRRFVTCASRADAVEALELGKSKRMVANRLPDARRPTVLMLQGVGDHYVGMGFDLYSASPVFAESVDRCAAILAPKIGIDIRTVLFPAGYAAKRQEKSGSKGIDLKAMLAARSEAVDPDTELLNRTRHAQPALFTVEYALAQLWQSLGVVPDAIVCHSMGEYVAACLAGVMSLEDALHLIATRAKLVEQLPEGAMLAVMLPENELAPLLGPALSISLINGPALCVVAGPPAAVAELEATLGAKGVICRRVQNTHAFHSRMLDPIVDAFVREVRKVRLAEPKIRYTSNVTGKWIDAREATDPAYWGRHANHTARFSDALAELWQLDDPILLEAGPGRTLSVLAMQHPQRSRAGTATVVASMRPKYENAPDEKVLLEAVGHLWSHGVNVDWRALHGNDRRRRVALPTYPFERQEYWIEQPIAEPARAGAAAAAPVSAASSAAAGVAGIDGWFYTPSFERAPLASSALKAARADGCWLVLAGTAGRAAAFRRVLEARGARVYLVRGGESFSRAADGSFEIDADSAADYTRLLRELDGAITAGLDIVHLGSLEGDLGFMSLVHIAQAINEARIGAPVRISVVSNQLHEVIGGERLDPTMAPVLGAVQTIPHELPNVACFNVDLADDRLGDSAFDEAAAAVVAEHGFARAGDVLAYRGKHRWKRTYERVVLPAVDAAAPLRERGVYLITGGTGGLGLSFAKHLAKTCRAKLVLTRRSPLPDKSQWSALAASSPATRDAKIVAELLEIERLGGDVTVFAAEASDRAAMQRVVAAALERFGRIDGALHAAGSVKPGLITGLTGAAAEQVLAPKVQGTRILFDLLKDAGADFLLLFSSMSSVTAPYAHGDYCAANWFLDAFAAYANSVSRLRTVAVNWPVWKEAGIALDGQYSATLEGLLGIEDLQGTMLARAMPTADGLEAFARVLASGFSQVVVSPENLHALIERSATAAKPASTAAARASGQPASDAAGDGADDERNDIEAEVTRIWTDVFGHRHIGLQQSFAELGGHSLIAMQIVSKLKAFYEIDLSLRDFFAAPTIAGLSAEIETRLLREIEGLSDQEAARLVQAASLDTPN